MTITVEDYISVSDRARILGCPMPDGIGVMPTNFESAPTRQDLLFISEAATVKTLLRNNGIAVSTFLQEGERVPAIHNKHFDWAPVLFVSASLLSNDPNLVSIALGIVSNYATDFFRGLPGQKVRLRIVVEKKKDRSCKEVNYEGDVEGLKELPDIIRSIGDE